MNEHSETVSLPARGYNAQWTGPLIALALQACIISWLYAVTTARPPREILAPVLLYTLAGTGVFLLTGRWTPQLPARLLAALFYALAPLGITFIHTHISLALLYALFPWLNAPAALFPVGRSPTAQNRLLTFLFALLPAAAILGLFYLDRTASFRPFTPLPDIPALTVPGLKALLSPYIADPAKILLSAGHIPLLIGLLGGMVYVHTRKRALLLILLAALILSFVPPLLGVAPVLWLLFAYLYFAVFIGLGMQTLIWAGRSDKHYLLICILFSAGLWAAARLLSLNYGSDYLKTAQIYSLAAVMFSALYFIAAAGSRWQLLRWTLTGSALLVDILLCARLMIESAS